VPPVHPFPPHARIELADGDGRTFSLLTLTADSQIGHPNPIMAQNGALK
jgi:hypothetical protein